MTKKKSEKSPKKARPSKSKEKSAEKPLADTNASISSHEEPAESTCGGSYGTPENYCGGY